MSLPKEKKPRGRRAADTIPDTTVDEKKEAHWSDYMYGSYDAETEVISLYRLMPKEHLGVPTAGWLVDVEPGMHEPYIRDNYGGGQYRLNKRSRKDGQISASCTFDLPGFPKVSSAADPKRAIEGQGVTEPVMLTVDGAQVPFTGDLQKFADFVMVMKGIKSIFPDPPDINAALLEVALKRETTDPLETIRTLKEASNLFGGASETGSNVYDLLKGAIDQAGPVIRGMMSPGVKRLARPVAPRSGPGNGSGKLIGAVPVTDPGDADKTGQLDEPETSKEESPMSQKDLILAVVSTIVSGWKLRPPKTVTEMVEVVDLILDQADPAVRQALVDNYSERILNICEIQLAEEWLVEDSEIGDRKAFAEFFSKVFTEYARSDRQVMSL